MSYYPHNKQEAIYRLERIEGRVLTPHERGMTAPRLKAWLCRKRKEVLRAT